VAVSRECSFLLAFLDHHSLAAQALFPRLAFDPDAIGIGMAIHIQQPGEDRLGEGFYHLGFKVDGHLYILPG
jgi:hypothetical protein